MNKGAVNNYLERGRVQVAHVVREILLLSLGRANSDLLVAPLGIVARSARCDYSYQATAF